jgi:hypothetical protein
VAIFQMIVAASSVRAAAFIVTTTPRGPGGGEDPPLPPGGGVGSRNKIFGCFIGTVKSGTIAIGNGSGMNAAGIVDNAGIPD